MKFKYLKLWSGFAVQVGALSHCKRLKVGCVLVSVDGERCLSFGYNGTYRGGPNEINEVPGSPEIIHAECNALIKNRPDTPFSAIVTATPCYPCAMMLINSGVYAVYALTQYRDPTGWNLLRGVLGERAILVSGDPSVTSNPDSETEKEKPQT